jgi:Ca-activated chloride channel family protein
VLFVLDLSGSMWGRVEGREKIAIAREVLAEVLADLPEYVAVGLEVYGHRSREDCDDIEVVAPVGDRTPKAVGSVIAELQPRGQTPLSRALLAAYDEVSLLPGSAYVVLLSDGKETCGGDPCELMADLRATGSRVSYHVIGFDVTAAERAQLECIARAGRGDYYAADNAEDLTRALATVRRKVLERVEPD